MRIQYLRLHGVVRSTPSQPRPSTRELMNGRLGVGSWRSICRSQSARSVGAEQVAANEFLPKRLARSTVCSNDIKIKGYAGESRLRVPFAHATLTSFAQHRWPKNVVAAGHRCLSGRACQVTRRAGDAPRLGQRRLGADAPPYHARGCWWPWYASEQKGFITGQILAVDGGASLACSDFPMKFQHG
jgi:hypothetical protein